MKQLSKIIFLFFTTLLLLPSVSGLSARAESAEAELLEETPFQTHGALQVSKTQIVDEDGEPFQLRGVSTHGIAWYPDYVSKETFQTLRDDWNVNVVRLAMYTDDYLGYCSGDDANRQYLKDLISQGVEAATELGLYVIIDWHVLSDQTPLLHQGEAQAFFQEISSLYQDYDNVIYEICNEPNGAATWSDITAYALPVIDIIRANDPDSLIIVGTPTWCQDVDQAAAAPLDRPNVVYALHFYAGTHQEELRQKAASALEAGLPLLVSEFGIVDASGNGALNTEQAELWISMLDSYQIGYLIWNLSNKDESSSLLSPSSTAHSQFTEADLSESGLWFYQMMTGQLDLPIYLSLASAQETAAVQMTSVAEGDQSSSRSYDNGCTVNTTIDNTWEADGLTYTQFKVVLQNQSSTAISNWRLRLTWSCEVTEQSYWNCQLGGSGDNRLAIPMDYNSVISAGGEQEFGLIVSSQSSCSLIQISFE